MAQDLELKVSSSQYEQRIATLQGYISRLEGIMGGYESLRNRVSDFMGDDDNVEKAREAAAVGIKRCEKAIRAVQENIQSLQEVVQATQNIGKNVKTVLEAAVEAASAGLFD